MICNDHLQVFDLVLKVRTPLHIGNGQCYAKTEYLFDAPSKVVRLLDMNRFFALLANKGLVDDYERFVFSGQSNMAHFFQNCGVTGQETDNICRCRINASDALDGEHSLKEIHGFIRGTDGFAYIPGSSVKGALRTVLLFQLMRNEKKGHWPEKTMDVRKKNAQQRPMQLLEGEYLNSLHLKKDRQENWANDAVNSIMRGISISDSSPISNSAMVLCEKTDALPTGEAHSINLCRECVKPGTEIVFKLTLDHSVLNGKIDDKTIMAAIWEFADFYSKEYCSYFYLPRKAATVSYQGCLILGGGSGFFSKSLAYPYLGDEKGIDYMENEMNALFPKARHRGDVDEYGISPRTMKYCKYNGSLYPYGLCEVILK